MRTLSLLLQIATASLYCCALLADVIPVISNYTSIIQMCTLGLLAIHTTEFVWVRKTLLLAQPNAFKAALLTILFGVTYWQPLVKRYQQAKLS